MTRCLLVVLLISVPVSILFAEELHVPDDFDTIQEAIDAARNGDAVIVDEGEYVENIDFDGKAISIIGNPDDPASTVIDGNDNGRVVTFAGNEMRNSILTGFTIRYGAAGGHGGGGIYCNGTIPIIENLIVEDNIANRGGGILCWNASPIIRNVIVRGNIAVGHGGGICLSENSNAILTNVQVQGNYSENNGGGIASYSRGEPAFDNVTITNNTSRAAGGGMYILDRAELTNVIISDNEAGSYGGGIFGSGRPELEYVAIDANEADHDGGGLYFNSGRPILNYTRITRNSAGNRGGGFYIEGTDPQFDFVTISGNESENDGGGLYCTDHARPVFINGIIWNNYPQGIFFSNRENSIEITYCDIEDGEEGIEDNGGNIAWGEGNIDADPLFEDADEGDFQITWENYPDDDDTKSPCVDTADPEAAPNPDQTRADMGALYYPQPYPDINIEPDGYVFDNLMISDSAEAEFTISNIGNAVLEVSEQQLEQDGDDFSIIRGGAEVEIQPDGQYITTILFSPTSIGLKQAVFIVESNDPDEETVEVNLVGIGLNRPPEVIGSIPDIEVDEDFGRLQIADLDTVFEDSEGEELNYTVISAPQELNMRIDESMLVMTPTANYNLDGGTEITAIARDPHGVTGGVVFSVRVIPVNDEPGSFNLISPENGARLPFETVTFDWESPVDYDDDFVRYNLFLDFSSVELDSTLEWEINPDHSDQEINVVDLSSSLGLTNEIAAIWWVEVIDGRFAVDSDQRWLIVIPSNSVSGWSAELPTRFLLSQNYPNPFNSITSITYAVPRPLPISINVYDLAGREVRVLINQHVNTGYHTVVWDAEDCRSGIYIIKMETEGFRSMRQIVLLK
ncbi:MAG: T9SS type A sorting domain-containing protein [Candidatus Hatepunaea meridiana]|nr:T9SS type A sorting domain-containing protein [Candidatus Hatepunaea meridiana]